MMPTKELLQAIHLMTGFSTTSEQLRAAVRSTPAWEPMEIGAMYDMPVGGHTVHLIRGDQGWVPCYGQALNAQALPLLAEKLRNVTPHQHGLFWAPDLREKDEDGRPRV